MSNRKSVQNKTISVSEAQQVYLDGIRREKIRVNCARVLILVIFIAVWEVCAQSGIINDFIFSSPSRIMKCFVSMCADGSLFRHVWVTLYETFISFFLVIGIGLTAAVLMWLSRSFSKIIEPYIVVLNSLPKSALAPILIVWLGNNIRTIIISAISVAVFGTILTLYTGFMEMDADKIKLIKTLGGTRFHVLTKVLIPGNLAVILNTMKVNMGLSLVGVIIGEFLAANEGLGYLIIYGSQVFKLDWVMLSIIILCMMATLLYQLINILEKVLSKRYI
jgi:NitT/TauT family transport system permease protein